MERREEDRRPVLNGGKDSNQRGREVKKTTVKSKEVRNAAKFYEMTTVLKTL